MRTQLHEASVLIDEATALQSEVSGKLDRAHALIQSTFEGIGRQDILNLLGHLSTIRIDADQIVIELAGLGSDTMQIANDL